MKKEIYPCIWFDGKALEAAEFYCSVFNNSRIKSTNPLVVQFELRGKLFMGLNGGPKYKPNPAVSFVVECEDQAEIDHYWTKLSEGGHEDMCGWLQDKYSVSWQIVPTILGELMNNKEKAPAVMAAFLKMRKFEIAKLMEAAKN